MGSGHDRLAALSHGPTPPGPQDFTTADDILRQLRGRGVEVNDRTSEWRAGYTDREADGADGRSHRQPPELEYSGQLECARQLGAALLTQWRGDGRRRGQAWTHGFHPYKALMEPLCVAQLLQLLPGDGAILDPFVGSGTTLIEVMVAGRPALGCDLSPLAVGIARHHCWRPSQALVDELRTAMAGVIAALAKEEAAAEAAAAAAATGPATQTQALERAHALMAAHLQGVEVSSEVAAAMWFLLSHEVVYVWPEWRTPRPLSWRLDRTMSRYIRQVGSLADAVPQGTPKARVELSDARQVRREWMPVDGVLTSPPYPGVYDYLELTPPASGLAQLVSAGCEGRAREIGSRGERRELDADPALGSFAERWQSDTVAWLEAALAVLRPHGRVAILIGDDSGVNSLESITAAAATISHRAAAGAGPEAGANGDSGSYTLRVIASASITDQMTRPWAKQSSRGRGYRREHTILMEKVLAELVAL